MPKILIADDSIAVRKVAERLLTEAGMGVTLAANGSEALALLSKDRPDLIVSDVIMPDKSGYEVCAFIRAQTHLSDLPVLLISGIVNDEVSRQADACKADGVLKKPFQGTSLKDRVMDLLMKRQAKPEPTSDSAPVQAASSIIQATAITQSLSVTQDPVPDLKTEEPNREPLESSVSLADSTSLADPSSDTDASMPLGDQISVDPSVLKNIQAQHDARIEELQAQWEQERREGHDRIQEMQRSLNEQHDQYTDLSSRHEALAQDLAQERDQRTALTAQLEEALERARRVETLEAEVEKAHQSVEELTQQISDHARQASRIVELEAHLTAERGAAAQLVQQLTALELVERRAHELETMLASERDQAEVGRIKMAAFEASAARVPELEQAVEQARAHIAELEGALTSERETAAVVMAQVKQLETTVQKVHDMDLALTAERERSAQLLHRLSEAEHLAEQSTRRFEDLARKLGEIAGLASQLGNGKR